MLLGDMLVYGLVYKRLTCAGDHNPQGPLPLTTAHPYCNVVTAPASCTDPCCTIIGWLTCKLVYKHL